VPVAPPFAVAWTSAAALLQPASVADLEFTTKIQRAPNGRSCGIFDRQQIVKILRRNAANTCAV